ncbi:MAG TPA: PAS domain-containing protein, partial [Longimicrobiaceae bacterium]|nr:PAS domain-containing protein [Longimicrobiaceae bacterium]
MAKPLPLPQQLLALVDEVHRAPTCDRAMSLLAQRALALTGSGRALVLVRRGGDLRGVAAAGEGMADDEARGVVVPVLDVTSAAARAVRDRAPAESGQGEALGGMSGYLAIPLPGTGDDLLGALAVESAGLDEGAREAAVQLAEHTGPALARAAEVERLRAAATRAERERGLLAAIVEALPEPVLITGPANRILLENRRAAVLFSAKDEDATELRRTGELNNLLLTSFLTRAAAGKGTGRELNLVDPAGGKDLVFEVLSTPLPEGLYDEGATVSVLRDVTELKGASTELEHQFRRVRQGEAKARRERDRLNVILENVSDPILVTDPDGSVTMMNREAERLFEASAGSGAAEQVARNHESFAGFVGELGAAGESTRSGQLRLADPATGAQFPAEVVSCKILNDGGE